MTRKQTGLLCVCNFVIPAWPESVHAFVTDSGQAGVRKHGAVFEAMAKIQIGAASACHFERSEKS